MARLQFQQDESHYSRSIQIALAPKSCGLFLFPVAALFFACKRNRLSSRKRYVDVWKRRCRVHFLRIHKQSLIIELNPSKYIQQAYLMQCTSAAQGLIDTSKNSFRSPN